MGFLVLFPVVAFVSVRWCYLNFQRGDPVGPLLFALAWQPVVLAVQSLNDAAIMEGTSAWQRWYADADDGNVFGSGAQFISAYSTIRQRAAPLGAEVNAAKCRLLGPNLRIPADSPLGLVPVAAWLLVVVLRPAMAVFLL